MCYLNYKTRYCRRCGLQVRTYAHSDSKHPHRELCKDALSILPTQHPFPPASGSSFPISSVIIYQPRPSPSTTTSASSSSSSSSSNPSVPRCIPLFGACGSITRRIRWHDWLSVFEEYCRACNMARWRLSGRQREQDILDCWAGPNSHPPSASSASGERSYAFSRGRGNRYLPPRWATVESARDPGLASQPWFHAAQGGKRYRWRPVMEEGHLRAAFPYKAWWIYTGGFVLRRRGGWEAKMVSMDSASADTFEATEIDGGIVLHYEDPAKVGKNPSLTCEFESDVEMDMDADDGHELEKPIRVEDEIACPSHQHSEVDVQPAAQYRDVNMDEDILA